MRSSTASSRRSRSPRDPPGPARRARGLPPRLRQGAPEGTMNFDPTIHRTGWIDDPARHALARTFAPPLALAAPHLMGADQDVLLYRAWKDVLGDYPRYVA